jgi:hypothetical protein
MGKSSFFVNRHRLGHCQKTLNYLHAKIVLISELDFSFSVHIAVQRDQIGID